MTADFGSVSSGTMRDADLLSAFADTLRDLCGDNAAHVALCDEADKLWDVIEGFADDVTQEQLAEAEESAADVVQELFDALEEYAPPYAYFGAHPSDGADYGFWLLDDAIDDAVRYGDAIKVDDMGDVPADWRGDVFLVTDHGNVALYARDEGATEWREVWSLV